jgi:hypothetical protein
VIEAGGGVVPRAGFGPVSCAPEISFKTTINPLLIDTTVV